MAATTGTLAPWPSPVRPAVLVDGEVVAAAQPVRTGNAVFDFEAGEKGRALVLSVNCQGEGRVEVSLRPSDTVVRSECGGRGGEATSEYHQFDVDGTERGGTVGVRAPSGVRWSVAVGRREAGP
ncbi:hypothetical protein [Streptomyces lichenis]|uniref:Uncharacterized protein n=1 Tax=Streptomyces lichenis TaxID=2306967 RepID=A0ABT0I7N4_9ACTN|nr:hypothetical protein [Streptomyces lichenis]MCK8677311.1 hypothetical protein [Streptomyces lichenis]